jgi:hypothetical protein
MSDIRVTPASVAYGEVWKRKTATGTVRIVNRTYRRLSVTVTAPAGFTPSETAISLPADADFIAQCVQSGQVPALRRATRRDNELADILRAGGLYPRAVAEIYATGNE